MTRSSDGMRTMCLFSLAKEEIMPLIPLILEERTRNMRSGLLRIRPQPHWLNPVRRCGRGRPGRALAEERA